MIARTALTTALLVSFASTCGRCGEGEGEGEGAGPDSAAAASAGSSRVLSCDRVTQASVCSEYTGVYLAHNDAVLRATCGKLKGTFAYAECPNSSVVGTCTLPTTETRRFFGSGGTPYDQPRAQRECETSYKGKWVAFN